MKTQPGHNCIFCWNLSKKIPTTKMWSKQILKLDSILVGDHRVERSDKARNIGVVFHETLSLDKRVSSVCKSALFHLRNIAKIRMYLTSESTKTLVHVYVTCWLDNCNSLLLGSLEYIIQKLQRVQNCAARLVAGQPRAAHIRPVLKAVSYTHLTLPTKRIV